MATNPFDSKKHLADIAALYALTKRIVLKPFYRWLHFHPWSVTVQPRARACGWRKFAVSTNRARGVTDLLSQFGLTSHEGLALMCLAEALLRIPDRATADALIRDKLSEAHWNEAIGTGAPWAINATGWALALTVKSST